MIFDRFRLTDQVVTVTGASHGIGRAISLALAEAGADVVVVARQPADLEVVAAEIRARGRRALAVPADINVEEELDRIVQRTLDAFGRIDVLVNNAGGADESRALDTSDRALEGAFHTMVTSQFHLARASAEHLARSPNGNIVNVSAVVGCLPARGFFPYATARAAQLHMTRLLALEWAPQIRVNAVVLGGVETGGLKHFLEAHAGMRETLERATPLARLGQPEDVAAAVLYLASPAAAWVTGKWLEIDGGIVSADPPFPFQSGLGTTKPS